MATTVRTDERSYTAFDWVQLGKSTCIAMKKNLNPTQFSRLLWIFSSKQISSKLLQCHQQYRLSIFNNCGILFVLTIKPGVISVNCPLIMLKGCGKNLSCLSNFIEDTEASGKQAQGKRKRLSLIPSLQCIRSSTYLAGGEVSDPDSQHQPAKASQKQTNPNQLNQSKPTKPKAASKKPKPAPDQKLRQKKRTAYPKFKRIQGYTVDEQIASLSALELSALQGRCPPPSSSPLQHLPKGIQLWRSIHDDKPRHLVIPPMPSPDIGRTTDTEAESMVSVTIQQDTSVIPPMTSPVIGPVPRPDSPNVHWPLPTTTTTTSATTTTTLPLPPQPQQGPSDPIIIKRMGELEELIANLVEENQALEARLDKQGSRINKLETMDLPKMIREQTVEFIDSQEIDRKINESVKEVVISSVKHAMRAPLRARFKDLPTTPSVVMNTPLGSPPSPPPPPPPPLGTSGASGITRASDSTQAPPPLPPSSSTHQGGQSTSTTAPSSSKIAASAEYSAWTTTDTQIKPSITMIPDDLYMDDETTAYEQAYSSGKEVGRDHIPTVNLRQSWWKPLTEDRPATSEPGWTIPSSDLHVPTNNWASALKTTYVPPPENSLLAQTGDIATFMDWYCKRQGISKLTPKDLEGPAYEIVKVFHPDVVHLQF
ncbi:hypothetical protein Tco_1459556 [Tanacetum coccineum]